MSGRAKRWLRALSLGLALWLGSSGAIADGVTLRTASSFGGTDPASLAYQEILQTWQQETGNFVEDSTVTSNESWKTKVLSDFAAGNEPDILFFFAAGGDSAPILSRVVPIEEINAAYPEVNLPESDAVREKDGKVYAIPTSGFWEGVFLRTDLFEQYGAPLPTDMETLTEAVRIFRENGIVPIAASLSDVPHYVAEMALLACTTPEEQQARPQTLEEVPESWLCAMDLIRELYEIGAFGDDALTTYDRERDELFKSGKAAMRVQGSWYVDEFDPETMEHMAVLTAIRHEDGGLSDCCIGGVSMGFYLTRRAWQDEKRRDAAVSLLSALTSPENMSRLGFGNASGQLQEYALRMQTEKIMLSPLQDDMVKAAREVWLLDCVPAVAAGNMTAEECWERVMQMHPFETGEEN